MKFNPVGSFFKEGDITLQVVETKDYSTCKGCWYAYKKRHKGKNYRGSCYTHGHACTSGNRRDNKQVIFKEVCHSEQHS